MLIDPLIVIAQVVNFLVLVVVLKFVLYDRIIAAMDTREQRIAERIEQAELAQRGADEAAAHYRHAQDELAAARAGMLEEAREAAEQRLEELTEEARSQVDELRHRWIAALDREQRRIIAELQEHIGAQLVTVSRRALRDLAGADLEARAVTVGLERLLAEGAIERLAARADDDGGKLEVHTAHPLPDEVRREVEQAIARACERSVPLRFATDPALLCGLEVRAAGQAAGWSLAGYLDELGQEVARALPTEGTP